MIKRSFTFLSTLFLTFYCQSVYSTTVTRGPEVSALAYWEKQGLIFAQYSDRGSIDAVEICDFVNMHGAYLRVVDSVIEKDHARILDRKLMLVHTNFSPEIKSELDLLISKFNQKVRPGDDYHGLFLWIVNELDLQVLLNPFWNNQPLKRPPPHQVAEAIHEIPGSKSTPHAFYFENPFTHKRVYLEKALPEKNESLYLEIKASLTPPGQPGFYVILRSHRYEGIEGPQANVEQPLCFVADKLDAKELNYFGQLAMKEHRYCDAAITFEKNLSKNPKDQVADSGLSRALSLLQSQSDSTIRH
jgi:hypothetical protein